MTDVKVTDVDLKAAKATATSAIRDCCISMQQNAEIIADHMAPERLQAARDLDALMALIQEKNEIATMYLRLKREFDRLEDTVSEIRSRAEQALLEDVYIGFIKFARELQETCNSVLKKKEEYS